MGRWAMCPCIWPLSRLCCCCVYPSGSPYRYNVPGEKELAAELIWFKGFCKFAVPEMFGGMPGPEWWSRHHGNVPYTIMTGSKDDVCSVPEQERMQNAAPHGRFADKFEGAKHELFTNDERDWPVWVSRTAHVVLEYIQSPSL